MLSKHVLAHQLMLKVKTCKILLKRMFNLVKMLSYFFIVIINQHEAQAAASVSDSLVLGELVGGWRITGLLVALGRFQFVLGHASPAQLVGLTQSVG